MIAELVSNYPPAVLKLVDLFKRIGAADAEASSLNNRAPTGARILRTVEASIGNGEKIIEKVVLPVLTAKGVETCGRRRTTGPRVFRDGSFGGS